ncbi:MAG TPA: hypothetical protein VK084_07890 [Chitinophagaceae bacterium]|nr:hypothetical protein [Chitinophagaceae bacterium]
MNKDTLPKTLGELKKSKYQPQTVKDEVRKNLVERLESNEPSFKNIIGYDNSVIPDVERAILSKHNILFLGLRGQAKTRMARQITDLLDDYIPVIEGSEINDDPFHPISIHARNMIAEKGDDTPITWLSKADRYGEKLATPDVTVADLIGDIDPIKAANLHLNFADERVLHYGIIPRSNRGIFVINELPDLQARIQVSLFNILQEGDIQIRGFKLRMPLDILFVFTANPEDYTNRGSIVTPLKDRIESQIITHYPKSLETAMEITKQEARFEKESEDKIYFPDLLKQLIEQIAFEARTSEYVDGKSGVSARMSITAYENALSTAERRLIINKEKQTQVWISDLLGIIPSITGKIELVYEGEQEGPEQVAINLLERAIRSQFLKYFPNPEAFKKRRKNQQQIQENPYRNVVQWFEQGNKLQLDRDVRDKEKQKELGLVDGLPKLVKKYIDKVNNQQETALWEEFILHGLAAFSLISKKILDTETEFGDLLDTIMNLGLDMDDDDNEIF